MLRLSSAAAAFRPANPAAQGAMASLLQQQQSLPQPNTAAQGMCRLSAAAALQPADPARQGGLASQQQKIFHAGEFDHFVVIDFEATCERDSPQEIIEFPAVLVDAATGSLLSAFRTYVKPRHHPRLTAFCTELTGIKQEQVDGGVDLPTALRMHDEWLASAGASKNHLAVVTWGDWDCETMLEFECSFKCITKPRYFDQWINLRIPFEAVFGAGRRNLQEAVREAGLQWDGRLHCGLDDARNTARLLVELMRRGASISITGSLPQPPPPPSKQSWSRSRSRASISATDASSESQPQLASAGACARASTSGTDGASESQHQLVHGWRCYYRRLLLLRRAYQRRHGDYSRANARMFLLQLR